MARSAIFYVDGKPEQLAETTAQVFLGCPHAMAPGAIITPWKPGSQEDYYGLANYFSRLQKKDNGDAGRFGGAKMIRASTGVVKEMRPKMVLDPHAFGVPAEKEAEDVRQHLAAWITASENPYFARNWANRLTGPISWVVAWSSPLTTSEPPTPHSIPQLLNALSDDFAENGYDLKHLIRTICTSNAYALASRVTPEHDVKSKFHTHRRMERLSAEVLADAIDQATAIPEEYEGTPLGNSGHPTPGPQDPIRLSQHVRTLCSRQSL